MAAAAILNWYLVTLDHAQSLLHGPNIVLKFHVNPITTIRDMVIWTFCRFGSKRVFQPPKIYFLGVLTPKHHFFVIETREPGCVHSRDCQIFLSTTYYPRNGYCYELQIFLLRLQGPSEQKSIKICEKRERGRIQGLPTIYEYLVLSQEWVKLQSSNLTATFTATIRKKSL